MSINERIDLADIEQILSRRQPRVLDPVDRGQAAVAMILRQGKSAPEVLFIVRAEHEQDPWSGNIGFPGGRLNPSPETPRQAAERETREELALDLSRARYLGRLDDLYGAILPVLVSCFVYRLQEPVPLQPNHEVADLFWCSFDRLLEPCRHQHRNFDYRGAERCHPAIELLSPGQPLLWGITYRLIRSFFASCQIRFGEPERSTASKS